MRATPTSLRARVDAMAAAHGPTVAQIFVPSGDPDGAATEMSFTQLASEIRRRSSALAALGIGRRDRLCLMTPLGEHGLATLLGAMTAATIMPVNYFLAAEALGRLIDTARPAALLVARSFADDPSVPAKVRALQGDRPDLRVIAYGAGDELLGALDLDAALAEAPDEWPASAEDVDPDRIVALFHTGGTTGLPKLVPHTEAMYDAMIDVSAGPMGATLGNRMLGGLPLFHTSGALQAGIVPLLNGCSVIIPSPAGFRGPGVIAGYWRFASRFRATIGGSVPTVLAAISAISPAGDLSALRHILCGGAPLPPSTIAAIAALTGGAEVIEGWGMTETCGFSVLNPIGATVSGSVGLPFPGMEAQIRALGDDGQPLPDDQIGELVVRGAIVITGYLDERPDAFTADGWLRTGDLARRDAAGYLYIVGRAKDLIIRGGHNIDPAIIETPAYQHPAVELAAAIGRPDRYAGELPILFVQLRHGMVATPDELVAFVGERIQERAALPKAIHIVDAMPLSGPGKIHKAKLRHQAIQEVLQEELDQAFAAAAPRATIADDPLSGIAIRLNGNADILAKAAATLSGYPFKIILG